MDAQIFKRHLKEFYPLIMKLICCDQVYISMCGLVSKCLQIMHIVVLEF
jgi:hypothetical protein